MGAQAAERRRAIPLAHSSVANRNRPYSWPQPALLLLPRLPSQLLLLPSLLPPSAVAAAPSSSGSLRRWLNDGSPRSDSRPGRGRDPSSVTVCPLSPPVRLPLLTQQLLLPPLLPPPLLPLLPPLRLLRPLLPPSLLLLPPPSPPLVRLQLLGRCGSAVWAGSGDDRRSPAQPGLTCPVRWPAAPPVARARAGPISGHGSAWLADELIRRSWTMLFAAR
jgi:hypothetical protein